MVVPDWGVLSNSLSSLEQQNSGAVPYISDSREGSGERSTLASTGLDPVGKFAHHAGTAVALIQQDDGGVVSDVTNGTACVTTLDNKKCQQT